jgi:hypothetical protein
MTKIWALYRQSGSDRLEKQTTDLRQNTSYFGDRTLAGAHDETLGVARFPLQIFGNFRLNVGAIVATAAVVSAEVCAIGHVGGSRIGIGVGVRVGRLIGATLV